MPKKLREELALLPQVCARKAGECAGRITWEHCLTFAGRQVQEAWAIVFLCEYHHNIGNYQNNGGLNKRENQRIAFSRATEEELKKYPNIKKNNGFI